MARSSTSVSASSTASATIRVCSTRSWRWPPTPTADPIAPGGSTAANERRAHMPDISFTLGWVIYYVDEPAEAAAFYEQTFGLKVEFVAPGGSFAQLDTGGTKLAFASYDLGE